MLPTDYESIRADQDQQAEERYVNATPLVDACVREYGIGCDTLIQSYARLLDLAVLLMRDAFDLRLDDTGVYHALAVDAPLAVRHAKLEEAVRELERKIREER